MSNLNVTKDKSMTYEEWQKQAMDRGIRFFDESIVAFEVFKKYNQEKSLRLHISEYMYMGNSCKYENHYAFKHIMSRQYIHIPKGGKE